MSVDDTRLDAAMARLRQRRTPAARRWRPYGCLTLEHARRAMLAPARQTHGHRAHLDGCRRCRGLVASLQQNMPHLPLWALIRWRVPAMRGGLSDGLRRACEYHLEAGHCESCRARLGALESAAERFLRFPAGLTLQDPLAALAAPAAAPMVVRSIDEQLEAELIADARRATLEIRTRDVRLTRYLVSYSLRGRDTDEVMEGYTVLGEDVQGWYVAEVCLDPGDLYRQFGGRCEEVAVALVEPTLLTTVDGDRLVAAASREGGDPERHAAWVHWVEQVAPRQAPRGRGDDLLWAVLGALNR